MIEIIMGTYKLLKIFVFGSLQDWHQKMKVCDHLQTIVGLQEDLLSVRHTLKETRANIVATQKKKEEYKSLNRCVQFLVYKGIQTWLLQYH